MDYKIREIKINTLRFREAIHINKLPVFFEKFVMFLNFIAKIERSLWL